MPTLAGIKAKMKTLQQQHDAIIAKQKAEVIAEIKQKIADFDISAADLGYKGSAAKGGRKVVQVAKPKKSAKKKSTPVYRGPNNEEWAGGKGARPKWVKAVLDSGGDLEAYRIKRA